MGTETDDQGREWADHPKIPGGKILVSGPSEVRTAEVRAKPKKAATRKKSATSKKNQESSGGDSGSSDS